MGVWLGPTGGGKFYKYTGASQFSQSGNNWEIKLFTSGNFKFNKNPGEVDIFLVGAGAPGAGGTYTYSDSTGKTNGKAGRGGKGGECKTIQPLLQKRISYTVIIGDGNTGNSTSFESYIAIGGNDTWTGIGDDPRKQGGSGSSEEGNMRTQGHSYTQSSGGDSGYYAFGEATGPRYGAGGGGGGAAILYVQTSASEPSWTDDATTPGSGGITGGGEGGAASRGTAYNGNDATFYGAGGGGGGASGVATNQTTDGGKGGNGIVIIRNHRES